MHRGDSMALLDISLFSDTLQVDVSLTVIYPQRCDRTPDIPDGPYKVLYLLHGLKQNEQSYLRHSAIERYLSKLPLVVVMPSVGRSFYTDQVRGYPYFTFLTEELPTFLASTFHISTRREDTYIAGLSMGGYGAFKAALTRPDLYCKAASMSGALDIVALSGTLQDAVKVFPYEWEDTFGSQDVKGSSHDLMMLASQERAPKPSLYSTCGLDDSLLEDNRRVAKALEKTHDISYDEYPGGHTWYFWDEALKRVLDWLNL